MFILKILNKIRNVYTVQYFIFKVLKFLCVFVYLADILSAFCIPMGCEGTLIDLPFI